MMSWTPTLEEFIASPTQTIYEMVYPQQLSISLLLNGTRRLYLAQHYDAPPTDYSFLPGCLDNILVNIGRLLDMLAQHGIYRTFLPSYSETQLKQRHRQAHLFLLKGLEGLTSHPRILEAYMRSGYEVRFYGEMSDLPEELVPDMTNPPRLYSGKPKHYVYYGVDAGNPHNYIFHLSHQFSLSHGRAPDWEDMLELYYGDRTLKPLDMLVAFNRIYARLGIPPLLDGQDRIYATPVTPMALTETAFRKILYDYLYHYQDVGRDYLNLHPNELQRLKHYYAANEDSVIGLLHKYENLTYALPAPVWPDEMDLIVEPDEVPSRV
jgi:hypothetical protein